MINPPIEVNVYLTEENKKMIESEIIKKKNKISACHFADIHPKTFKSAMEGGLISNIQRDKLIEMCEYIKSGKKVA